MALLFAFSIQEQVEKYGAYVGLAAFLGLAVLTVLYFAQARELKRLRDWAGRAPERAQELEARVVAQADELRQAEAAGVEPVVERSGTVSPAQPMAKPATAAAAPSGNGRGTGTVAPIPPGPRPAVAVAGAAQAQAAAARAEAPAEPAPAEAPAEPVPADAPGEPVEAGAGAPTELAPAAAAAAAQPDTDEATDGSGEAPAESATGDGAGAPAESAAGDGAGAPAEPEPEAEPEPVAQASEPSGNGTGEVPAVIPRATPRPQPRPAPAAPLRASQPSRTATVPPRRPAAPARRDSGDSSRAGRLTLMVVGGIVAAAVVIFGATQLLGGDGNEPAPAPNVTQPPDATPGGGSGAADVADQRPDTVVVVLNGTATDGLAGDLGTKLVDEGYSTDPGMIRTGNNTDQQRQDSVVLYAPGKRRVARDVAQILGINGRPEEVDADTLALANNTGDDAAGHETDVVVVAGADLAS
jgi:hypothetical protein